MEDQSRFSQMARFVHGSHRAAALAYGVVSFMNRDAFAVYFVLFGMAAIFPVLRSECHADEYE